MKIAIDARESGTSTGRYIDKLVENLHKLKLDFKITLLVKPERRAFFKKTAPNFQILDCPYKEFTLGEQVGFLKQLNQLKPELVHFGMTQQPAFYKGKSVTTIHDLTTARFGNPAKNPIIFGLKQKVYQWLIKEVAKKSQIVIVPSEFVKADVAQYADISPEKIKVIYLAAEPLTAPAEPMEALNEQKFIMYVGRPNPHKNLNRLIDAFVQILETHPGLKLVLAGKPDKNYEMLQMYVGDRNLTSQVLFLGQIGDGQLRWLYENTKAYVFPSLSEGFGLPGLEAMSHGAPVVAAKVSCLPEIYGDAAHYFNPADINDMAAKISEVLDNFQLSTNLIVRGKAQAAKYSWKDTAKKTLEVYRALLA